jgi:transcriptional regulator with XRE-family HTH domain
MPADSAIIVAMRTARERAGLSARALAERAGTSHATLLAYEHDRIHPRVDTAVRIVEAAGFTLDVRLTPRVATGADPMGTGRDLVDVLLLAAALPSRLRPRHLGAPVFGRA